MVFCEYCKLEANGLVKYLNALTEKWNFPMENAREKPFPYMHIYYSSDGNYSNSLEIKLKLHACFIMRRNHWLQKSEEIWLKVLKKDLHMQWAAMPHHAACCSISRGLHADVPRIHKARIHIPALPLCDFEPLFASSLYAVLLSWCGIAFIVPVSEYKDLWGASTHAHRLAFVFSDRTAFLLSAFEASLTHTPLLRILLLVVICRILWAMAFFNISSFYPLLNAGLFEYFILKI